MIKNIKHMGKVASVVGVAALAVSCAPTDNLGTSIYKSDYTYDNNYKTNSYNTKDNMSKTNYSKSMRNYDYTKSMGYDMSTYDDYKKDYRNDLGVTYNGNLTSSKYPIGSDTYNNEMYKLQTNISSPMGKTYNNYGTNTGTIKRTVEGVAPTKNTYTYDYSSAKDIARYKDYTANTKTYNYRDNTDLIYNSPSDYVANTVDNMNYKVTMKDYTTTDSKYEAPKYTIYGNNNPVNTVANKSKSAMNKVAKDVERMTE